jgi:phosphoglycolate phosphatase
MNRLALFDCDGTLVDSTANICRAMERAFAAHRLEPPCPLAVRRIVGLSLPQAMAALLPDADAADHHRLSEAYKSAFHAMRGTPDFAHEPLFPGIADAISALDDDGWVLGVATGKSDRGLAIILEHHGLMHRFVTLQTADRHPSKPHPSMALTAIAEAGAAPETTVVIGDTSFDMGMARAAGAHAIGVAWGCHDAEELVAAGAHEVVGSGDRLVSAVQARLAVA